MNDTPRTDEILALLPGGQTCDPQAVADELRPAIEKMEREFDDWRALADRLAEQVKELRYYDGKSLSANERSDRALDAWREARHE